MKRLYYFIGAAALMAVAMTVSPAMNAQENGNRDENGKVVRGPYETNRFGDNWFIGVAGGVNLFLNEGYEPAVTLNAGDMLADLDGPNGELWYYTGRLYSRAIKYQYYTDYILEEYEFTLYNSKFEELGTIRDLVRYADDEVRVPGPQDGIDLLPTITRNYFNSDDKYEVLVSIAVNSSSSAK